MCQCPCYCCSTFGSVDQSEPCWASMFVSLLDCVHMDSLNLVRVQVCQLQLTLPPGLAGFCLWHCAGWPLVILNITFTGTYAQEWYLQALNVNILRPNRYSHGNLIMLRLRQFPGYMATFWVSVYPMPPNAEYLVESLIFKH